MAGVPVRVGDHAYDDMVEAKAVRVDDRASAIFVLTIVGVFVAIFVLAMLFGYGSLFGNVFKSSTPTPATRTPPSSTAPDLKPTLW